MFGYRDSDSYLDFADAQTLDEEIREQEMEVFHFRSVEHLPSEGGYND